MSTYVALSLILLISISSIGVNWNHKAFGSFDVNGNYFCNVGDLDDEKYRFRDQIDGFNQLSGVNPHDFADNILKQAYQKNLDDLGSAYQCLRDNNIDPDSVDKLSDNVMQGFKMAAEQNPQAFYNIAPNFAKNVLNMNKNAVPEFPLAQTIILVGIIGSIVIYRKFSNSIGNLHQ